MKLIVEGYLASWGGMRRWLLRKNSDSSDQIVDKVPNILNDNNPKVQGLVVLDLLNDLENARDDLKDIFDNLCSLGLKHGSFGVVATGKPMHMLYPKLCIIWDNENVLNKRFDKISLRRNGDGYYKYLEIKREELIKVIESFEEKMHPRNTIDEIEEEHSEFRSSNGYKDIKEPITKLLDECNYD